MSGLADETRWMDATDQAALVAEGAVTPSELLEAAIERIERSNPSLNAVVIEWFDHARSVAADPALPDGPFRGVPFLLKDLYTNFAGQTMSNGNVALKEAAKIDTTDTTLVARFKATGLVIADGRLPPRWAACRPRSRWPGGRPATRGGWTARPVGRAAGPPLRWPPGWCRSPTPRTAAGAFVSPLPAAGWWGSSRARGGPRSGRRAPRSGWASNCASAARCATRRGCSMPCAVPASATR